MADGLDEALRLPWVRRSRHPASKEARMNNAMTDYG
jgi:hypothetical protein